jgi:vancomycin permeability regulator SanA
MTRSPTSWPLAGPAAVPADLPDPPTVDQVTVDQATEPPTAHQEQPQTRRVRRWRRWLVRVVVAAMAVAPVGPLLLVCATAWIDSGARGHVYTAASVPAAPVALVLGAKVNPDGVPSPFLEARLALAKRLYDTGKVRVLLVSGDNRKHNYDEPDVMRRWLLAHGVPERKVVADYAGFDTYDSCARAKLIFGVTRAVVVTQSYHIPRAVSLCRHLGIDATGVGDDTQRAGRVAWRRAAIREWPACVKAVLDLATHRSPVFLGRHETGVEDGLRSG